MQHHLIILCILAAPVFSACGRKSESATPPPPPPVAGPPTTEPPPEAPASPAAPAAPAAPQATPPVSVRPEAPETTVLPPSPAPSPSSEIVPIPEETAPTAAPSPVPPTANPANLGSVSVKPGEDPVVAVTFTAPYRLRSVVLDVGACELALVKSVIFQEGTAFSAFRNGVATTRTSKAKLVFTSEREVSVASIVISFGDALPPAGCKAVVAATDDPRLGEPKFALEGAFSGNYNKNPAKFAFDNYGAILEAKLRLIAGGTSDSALVIAPFSPGTLAGPGPWKATATMQVLTTYTNFQLQASFNCPTTANVTFARAGATLTVSVEYYMPEITSVFLSGSVVSAPHCEVGLNARQFTETATLTTP